MAGLNLRCLVFAFAMAMAFLLLSGFADAMIGIECRDDKPLRILVNVTVPCEKFIDKSNKNAGIENLPKECCDAFRTADVRCLCDNIPKFYEKYASMEKFVFAAQQCNKDFPQSVTKCGSYPVRSRQPDA